MFNAKEIMELQNLAGMENFSKLTVKQALDREKLIELMRSFENNHNSIVPDKNGLAEFLIANDVVPVVRCGNCGFTQHSPYSRCVWCNKHHKTMKETDFCSYGERKDNE